MKLMQKNAGFTTMELMVVIAILAITSAIAIPNFFSWMPAKRLQSATAEVQSALQAARLRAVKENICVTIKFDTGSDSYLMFLDNGGGDASKACNGTQDAAEPTTKNGQLPSGVDLVSVAPQTKITFNSRGFPSDVTTVKMETESLPARTVELSLTGGTRIN